MKALVTGGAGFIGHHLVERLLADGHQVVVVDDLSSGGVANLEGALGRYGFLLRVVSLGEADALADCFAGVDWVFHLAGTGGAAESLRRPKRFLESHLQGTMNLLECARRFGVRSFVYAGCASIYGGNISLPTAEIARAAPETPHAVAKTLSEDMVISWARIYGLPAVSLRLFHVYGSGAPLNARSGSVVSAFLSQRAAGAPLTIAGSGQQTRDFVHVDDVVSALMLAAERRLTREIVNIGSGQPTSILRLAELVGGPQVCAARCDTDPEHVLADIRKAREFLGWNPEVSLEDGIQGLLMQLDSFAESAVWTAENLDRRVEAAREALAPTPPKPSASPGWPDAADPGEPLYPPSA